MTICPCGFRIPARYGEQAAIEHRRQHRQWERSDTEPVVVEARTVEITDVYVTLDKLIAHAHGGPLPAVTPGAQAILARQHLDPEGAQ